jgi:hypothetical protein
LASARRNVGLGTEKLRPALGCQGLLFGDPRLGISFGFEARTSLGLAVPEASHDGEATIIVWRNAIDVH